MWKLIDWSEYVLSNMIKINWISLFDLDRHAKRSTILGLTIYISVPVSK